MLRTIGTRHCRFLRTDYSMPVSSCPPSGLSFLSCNDEISLDFRLFIHVSIIVKEVKNFLARKSCFAKNKSPPHFLTSPSKRDLKNAFRALLVILISSSRRVVFGSAFFIQHFLVAIKPFSVSFWRWVRWRIKWLRLPVNQSERKEFKVGY